MSKVTAAQKAIRDLFPDIFQSAGRMAETPGLDQVPDVPQAPLERVNPPRGMSPLLVDILTPDAADRLRGFAEEGATRGGLEWYNTSPLMQAFQSELGPDEGMAQYARFMDIMSATSPRSDVARNLRRASYLYGQNRAGLPMVDADLPEGYGHYLHRGTHGPALRDIEEQGAFASLTRPKTSSFSQNLQGNYAPLTVDTHNMAALTGDPKNKISPKPGHYRYIEEFQKEIADKLGMTPAQFQASVWVGADDITGVTDSRPVVAVLDDVVNRTAERDNDTPENVLRAFIRGDRPLWSLVGGTALAAGTVAPEEAQAGVGGRALGLMEQLAKEDEEIRALMERRNRLEGEAVKANDPALANQLMEQAMRDDDQIASILNRPAVGAAAAAGAGSANAADDGPQGMRGILDMLGRAAGGILDIPEKATQGYLGLAGLAGGMAEGLTFDQALERAVANATRPTEDTFRQMGGYVTDQTAPYIGSTPAAALGTFVYTAPQVASPL